MKRIFGLCLVAILAITSLGSSLQTPAADDVIARVQSLAMFKAPKFNEHLRMARDEDITRILEESGILLPRATQMQRQMAIQEFRKQFVERNPTTPNPLKLQALMDKERGVARMSAKSAAEETAEPQIMSLVVPVEFPNSDTFDYCGTSVTTTGPLHNEMAAPGPRDNNTIWYEDASPELYNELYFGVGPKAGVIVNHPNLGKVDLRGNTMANYYLEQSEGKFVPQGEVYPKWLTAAHSEGWYGADGCGGGSHNVRAADLVREVIDQVKADSPDFAWQNFDGDGNGIVDNFTVIHAGTGQESGGGAQGDFSIWSHASMIDWPTGYLACAAGSAGCPDRDIYVLDYSMDPENIDIGVIAEEFGHAAFGLPDLYTTDYDSSIGDWAIMEAGSWNGPLAGMQPAPFPLWFRMLVGWASPAEVDYTTEPAMVKIGQLSRRPGGTESGIRINLPDKEVTIPNPLGTGQAWWSSVADLADFTLEGTFDLTGATAPVFSFNSYWSIETDYDGGFVEISTDGGATWVALDDQGGFMAVDNDLSGNNPDKKPVLTGEGTGILSFNLAAFAGQTVKLRLRYFTDPGVQYQGWWADDFLLDDGGTTLFSDDVETLSDAWLANGWQVVPLTNTYPRYYLVEWRNNSGFDRGLKYPYQTVYYDEDEWQVDRVPFTVPGALLYFRDASYSFDYTLGDSWYDPPSYGPKHALLVVDSHSYPYMWDTPTASGQGTRISRRVQTGDATFTLQKTTPFTLRLGYDPLTGEYQDTPLETKTFGPREAVSQFHDSMGYYPGLWYNENNGRLYFWDVAASAVVPAQGNYTTKITWFDNTPLYDLYGADLGDTVLGSGNPGDNGVQYGLHMAVVDQARHGEWGAIEVWNSPALLDLTMKASPAVVRAKGTITYAIKIINTTPVWQPFELSDPIPGNTTFLKGAFYDQGTNSIHWKGMVGPYRTQYLAFVVKVNKGVPAGTVITNQASLADGALGDSASVDVTTK